jgi:hypothetical protein
LQAPSVGMVDAMAGLLATAPVMIGTWQPIHGTPMACCVKKPATYWCAAQECSSTTNADASKQTGCMLLHNSIEIFTCLC